MTRVVSLSSLPAGYADRCQHWWNRLSDEKRAAVEAWLKLNPPPITDQVTYAYFAAPGAIEPWVVCRTSAKGVTPAWFAENQPNIDEVSPSGEVLVRYRESELVLAPKAQA
jgi:hypothetical protein